MFYKELMIYFI